MAVAIADFPAPLDKAPTLELRGVRKIFGDTTAVGDLDLALCRGEFLTFLGPSGSGKTTTLAMVAGLEKPTAGTITLDGLPLDPLPAYRRNIGVVFQNYALFPHMTVAGNVAFPLEMRGVGRQEIATRVNETLTLVGLPGFGARYPAQLSGGQQQRVALARAIVFRPPLLLMDEPLGALDKRLREQMQIEIMRLHREFGLSVLYVTHDQEEALVMSDRIAVFDAGRIEQVGTAQELYERPQTPFVAGFLGDSNFFRGKVRAIEGAHCLVDTEEGMLNAYNTAGLRIGDAAVVAIRPERLRIGEPTALNSITGNVSEIIYLGARRKCLLRTGSGHEVIVLQNAESAEGMPLHQGARITFGWQARDANALFDQMPEPVETAPNRRPRTGD